MGRYKAMKDEEINTYQKIEKWNRKRRFAQICGDICAEKYATLNLNRYLRKLHLPEATVSQEQIGDVKP